MLEAWVYFSFLIWKQRSFTKLNDISLPWIFSNFYTIQDAIECLNNLQTNAATLDQIKKDRQLGVDKLKASYSIPDMKKFLERLQIDVSQLYATLSFIPHNLRCKMFTIKFCKSVQMSSKSIFSLKISLSMILEYITWLHGVRMIIICKQCVSCY